MWETICDAWACWSGWNFGPNSMEYPHSEVGSEYSPPKKWKMSGTLNFVLPEYPPKMKNVRDFEFRVTGIPPQMKNVRDFEFHVTGIPSQNEKCQGLWISCYQNTPPKMKNVRDFEFRVTGIPPQWKMSGTLNFMLPEYPLKNEKCQRLWISCYWNNPPKKNLKCQGLWISCYWNTPPKKFKFRQILAF